MSHLIVKYQNFFKPLLPNTEATITICPRKLIVGKFSNQFSSMNITDQILLLKKSSKVLYWELILVSLWRTLYSEALKVSKWTGYGCWAGTHVLIQAKQTYSIKRVHWLWSCHGRSLVDHQGCNLHASWYWQSWSSQLCLCFDGRSPFRQHRQPCQLHLRMSYRLRYRQSQANPWTSESSSRHVVEIEECWRGKTQKIVERRWRIWAKWKTFADHQT